MQMGDAIGTIPATVVTGLTVVLEERAIGAGTVTRDGLKEQLNDVLQESGLTATVDKLVSLCSTSQGRQLSQEVAPFPPAPEQEEGAEASHGCTPFLWGGRLARVREDFTFPKGGPLTAWTFYLCGDEAQGYPPYRSPTHFLQFDCNRHTESTICPQVSGA